MRVRALRSIALGSAVCAAIAAQSAYAGAPKATLPIAPRLLVPARLAVPGFAAARLHLAATASATYWAHELVSDSPVEEVVEVGRLQAEGFAEAAYGIYRPGRLQAAGYAAALVLGSAASAQNEAREKVREEALGFGPGAITAPAVGLAGAVLVEQPHALVGLSRGRRLLSVVFSAGRCTMAVGAPIAHRVTRARARGAVLAAARALARQALAPCSTAPAP